VAIFWQAPAEPNAVLKQVVGDAVRLAPEQVDVDAEITARTAAAAAGAQGQGGELQVARVVFALVLVAAFVGAGIGCEAGDLTDGAKALYGLAATAFGIVVGLVTGERPSAGS
jgi:hypothetical protein